MSEADKPNVKQCCADFYGSDLARLLLGDSFHPGGVQLTERLGRLSGITADFRVVDVASGRGTSAFHLATTFGCRVVGIDMSRDNVAAANAEAARRAMCGIVEFKVGDAERLPLNDHCFDAVFCECAFCTFPDKAAAAREFRRVLKPGGRLAISDLTRSTTPLADLDGLLSWVACIGDAQPIDSYIGIFTSAGFQIECTEDHHQELTEMVRSIQGKLLGMELIAGLKSLGLPGIDFTTAKGFARAAQDAINAKVLGYWLLAGASK